MTSSSPHADDVVRAIVQAAASDVLETEHAALDDEPDGVHQHRTRVRRLRSVLAALRDHLDEPATERVRGAYHEWGMQLGVVRDFEVGAEVANAALEETGIDESTVRRRVVTAQLDWCAEAHSRLVELASEPRAAERRRMLRDVAALPAIPRGMGADGTEPEGAADDTRDLVVRTLAHEVKRTLAARRRLDGSAETYHALRKAGRRLRYVAEAFGEHAPGLVDVADLAAAGECIHDALGDHRDALLFGERLTATRVLAVRAGEPAAPYDALKQWARRSADDSLAELKPAIKRLKAARRDLR